MRYTATTLAILFLTFVSCSTGKEKKETHSMKEITKQDTAIIEKAPEHPTLINLLDQVPSATSVEDNHFYIEVQLWKNMMPSPDANHRPALFSTLSLVDRNRIAIPQDLTLTKQYFKQGEKIWQMPYDKVYKKTPSKYIGVIENGPEISVNKEVDIICEFEYQGKIYRISAKSQKVMIAH